MVLSHACSRGLSRALVLLLLALPAAGCGRMKLYPVEGRVLLDGTPLKNKGGSVVLKADASKGNAIPPRMMPVGMIQRDGTFKVTTEGRPGAPAGWYKVLVSATDAAQNPNNETRPLLNVRYTTEASTPLAFEVVPAAASGSYDLKLDR